MKIQMKDGRVLEGTALQIVQSMQSIAFGQQQATVPEYVRWLVANAERIEGVALDVGELADPSSTDEELCVGLVQELLRTGLAFDGRHPPPADTQAE